jgi:cytochrome P450
MMFDPIGAVDARFNRFGDIYRVQFAENALYVVRHPDHIRDVLVTNAAAFGKGHSAFERIGGVLGDSLLTSEGDAWRRQRRLVQPAFAQPRLAEYAAVMVEEAAHSAERLASAQGEVRDVSAAMTELTLSIVTRTLFGERVEGNPRVARAMSWLNAAFGSPEILPSSIPTPRRRRMQRAREELDAVVYDLIERRRAANTAGGDLLQRLLDARDDQGDGRGLSDKEIRDQLVTLYLAGHDTTSHALSWSFYLLSQNPGALAKLESELQRVLGGRLPTFDDLPALPYTEQVFKEAMRLYPPAMAIPRRATEDTSIGPYFVPAGSDAVIWVYRTHHDERFFPEPTRYSPERFDEVNTEERPKHAYLPFGAGQRACIGQAFAMIEGRLILATLTQRLKLTYAAKRAPGLRLGVTLAPKGGVPMRIGRKTAAA